MGRIPENTLRRLTHYLRCMQRLAEQGRDEIQSKDLAAYCKVSDSLVRRDLSYFGEFGKRGKGYSISVLLPKIRQIVGLDKTRNIAVVGIGNIGRALLNYPFQKFNFKVVGGFDIKAELVGKEINGIPIYHINDIDKIVKEKGISMAIVTVPEEAGDAVRDKIISAGIRGILSFVLLRGPFPKDVWVRYIELPSELEILSFYMEKGGVI
ncbi:MAG: redox-sensing transcriptional repressor Rex [bacterium]|nr:redox-sensing transcriptional repressor Rex [bacterium]